MTDADQGPDRAFRRRLTETPPDPSCSGLGTLSHVRSCSPGPAFCGGAPPGVIHPYPARSSGGFVAHHWAGGPDGGCRCFTGPLGGASDSLADKGRDGARAASRDCSSGRIGRPPGGSAPPNPRDSHRHRRVLLPASTDPTDFAEPHPKEIGARSEIRVDQGYPHGGISIRHSVRSGRLSSTGARLSGCLWGDRGGRRGFQGEVTAWFWALLSHIFPEFQDQNHLMDGFRTCLTESSSSSVC